MGWLGNDDFELADLVKDLVRNDPHFPQLVHTYVKAKRESDGLMIVRLARTVVESQSKKQG
jgi:hypothetical protein